MNTTSEDTAQQRDLATHAPLTACNSTPTHTPTSAVAAVFASSPSSSSSSSSASSSCSIRSLLNDPSSESVDSSESGSARFAGVASSSSAKPMPLSSSPSSSPSQRIFPSHFLLHEESSSSSASSFSTPSRDANTAIRASSTGITCKTQEASVITVGGSGGVSDVTTQQPTATQGMKKRDKPCALCPAEQATTSSGSWYKISSSLRIVNTPIVLTLQKNNVHECCAKCYMKNKRLWEKKQSLKTPPSYKGEVLAIPQHAPYLNQQLHPNMTHTHVTAFNTTSHPLQAMEGSASPIANAPIMMKFPMMAPKKNKAKVTKILDCSANANTMGNSAVKREREITKAFENFVPNFQAQKDEEESFLRQEKTKLEIANKEALSLAHSLHQGLLQPKGASNKFLCQLILKVNSFQRLLSLLGSKFEQVSSFHSLGEASRLFYNLAKREYISKSEEIIVQIVELNKQFTEFSSDPTLCEILNNVQSKAEFSENSSPALSSAYMQTLSSLAVHQPFAAEKFNQREKRTINYILTSEQEVPSMANLILKLENQ